MASDRCRNGPAQALDCQHLCCCAALQAQRCAPCLRGGEEQDTRFGFLDLVVMGGIEPPT